MKKTKLLMPMALGIATLTGTMMPLVSCGCKDKDSDYVKIRMTWDNENEWFCSEAVSLTVGINYQIKIDTSVISQSKWDSLDGKSNWSLYCYSTKDGEDIVADYFSKELAHLKYNNDDYDLRERQQHPSYLPFMYKEYGGGTYVQYIGYKNSDATEKYSHNDKFIIQFQFTKDVENAHLRFEFPAK